MRTGLALVLALGLAAQPTLVQGKTKSSPAQEAVAALEMCEAFAEGDVLALETAIGAGWDAYEDESESPFVRSYSAGREVPGIGWGDMFALVESYPDRTLGYCRIDIVEPKGQGESAIEALAALDGYKGDVTNENGGTYASLIGTGTLDSLLITHWDAAGFVTQLTILTPNTATREQ
ncbi:hypothetical protein GGR20_001651 [Devosia subaequoris]|uniref:Uncharacterized protein n=1 Tax=Devosia subaequoris TaxID=395930 RepID=A0A7W6ILX0_9HYPH|nr:hypothetical protein [Devosia subaequoris]MBB4052009.1 hypothetical protein [Devosia subaequoris]MCP1210173.1 hypothetical protein [Devosia subaequoris]